jgi:hypothetical protein
MNHCHYFVPLVKGETEEDSSPVNNLQNISYTILENTYCAGKQ